MTAPALTPARIHPAEGKALSVEAAVFNTEDVVCEVVDNFSALEHLAPAWDRLWRNHTDLSIFQNFSWIRAFWRAYGDQLQICSLVARHGDSVVGILPLVVEQGELQFVGRQESDYNDVICRAEDSRAVVHAFARYLLEMPMVWRSGFLENVASSSQFNRALQRLPRNLKRHFQSVSYVECPTIRLDCDREETLRRLLQRDSLKRHENRLKKLGALGFRHLQERDEIRRHLDCFFEQHTARHLIADDAGNRSLQFHRPRSRAFYRALVDELDPASELRFAVVELDGRPVAYHLGFESKGTYLWYKPTFDVDLWEYSPGEVLLRNLLRYARDSELREFDFTIGDEAFKHRFANCRKENLAIYIERSPASARSLFLGAARAGKGWIKRKPRILHLSRRARRWYWQISHRKQERGVWTQLRELSRAAFCKFVYSYEDALLFQADGTDSREPDRSPVRVEIASLSDLARLALEYPDFLNSSSLQFARKRFRDGDRAYIARQNGMAHLIWSSTFALPTKKSSGSQISPEAATLIEVHSTPQPDAESLADALRQVRAKQAVEQPVYIFCNTKNLIGIQAREAAGFSPRLRATAHRSLGIQFLRLRPMISTYKGRMKIISHIRSA